MVGNAEIRNISIAVAGLLQFITDALNVIAFIAIVSIVGSCMRLSIENMTLFDVFLRLRHNYLKTKDLLRKIFFI